MATYLLLLPDTQSSSSVRKKDEDKRFSLRTWTRTWNDPELQRHFAHLVCSRDGLSDVLQSRLLQNRGDERDDSRDRQEEKNDGHEKKSVQGPTTALPKRLDVNVCVALGCHSGVRRLVFWNSVQISNTKWSKQRSALQQRRKGSLCGLRGPCRAFYSQKQWSHTFRYFGKTRKSWISLSSSHTRPPQLGRLHMMRENTTRRLSAALTLLFRKRASGKRNEGKKNVSVLATFRSHIFHFSLFTSQTRSWQQRCCSEPPRTGEIRA